MPIGDRVGFFSSEIREEQLRIFGLPGQSFGLVDGEPKQMLMFLDLVAELIDDLLFNVLKLLQKFSARGDATSAEAAVILICSRFFIGIHNHLCFLVVVYLVK